MNYLPTCTSRLVVQHSCQVSFKSMQGCRRSWEDKLKCVKILSVKDHNSVKICRTWILSPHALLGLVVQHSCQVSFKSMQGCRRSWEDKLKCVKILSVKDNNSSKICRTWIISPHALLDLWYIICTKFHSNPCKDVGGVEKTNFDGTEGRNDGRTEWRTKQTLNAPLPFYGGGIKIRGLICIVLKKYLELCLVKECWQ